MQPPPDADPDADLAATYLRAYDEQLRDPISLSGALRWEFIGPVVAAEYAAGRGFVTYRSLIDETGAPLPASAVRELVDRVRAHFAADPHISEVEWKTRAHDHAPGLHEALLAADFTPAEPESIMVGEAALLAVDVPLPDGVTLRTITAADDVRRMTAMQDEVFGRSYPGAAESLLQRMATGRDDLELWIAEYGDQIVCAGRLEPEPGTQFAGIWGGCTRASWRGRGVYRALTAARARSALARGKTLMTSDSTEYSRPILERSGLLKVGTTTPYEWHRPDGP